MLHHKTPLESRATIMGNPLLRWSAIGIGTGRVSLFEQGSLVLIIDRRGKEGTAPSL